MELIAIFILCLLATSKVTLQGLFSKRNINTFIDGIFFNGLIFLFSAIVFIKNIYSFNLGVALYGMFFGILTVLFQSCYIKAMSCGNVSLTVLIVNLSMIIPIVFSIIVYKEQLSILRFSGVSLAIIALLLNFNKNEPGVVSYKWLWLSLLASLANGLLAICQQLFVKTQWGNLTKGFVAWGYITATVVSTFIYISLKTKGFTVTFKLKPSVFAISLSIGVILSVFQLVNTWAISTIDSTLLFPAYNGGTLILTSLTGVLILKDKLKRNQLISLLVGVVAIVIMNI